MTDIFICLKTEKKLLVFFLSFKNGYPSKMETNLLYKILISEYVAYSEIKILYNFVQFFSLRLRNE